jgi:FGGY-family pentulose kinase
MAGTYSIGIDLGTQSIRCGVVDQKGRFLAVQEEKYQTAHPKPGYAEQDSKEWLVCLDKIMFRCRAELGDKVFAGVAGISLCATSSTVVPVRNDQPLSDAILWMDTRAVVQAEQINKTAHEVLKYCGGEVSVEWLIPKMMWVRDNEPEIYKKADRIVEAQDFINHYLTGNWVASVSQAVCKSNYVEEKGGFSTDYFKAIGYPDFFHKANTRVLKQAEPVGFIRKEIANKYGLSNGTVVYQGGIDAHVNMIGLGLSQAGETGVVLGTSFVQLALVDEPFFCSGIWGPYKDAVVPDKYCLEGGQVSGGSIVTWFIREFCAEAKNPYALLEGEAQKVPQGSDGITLLDFFQGNRTPYKDPKAKGVFFGLTLSHTRSHMYRAILEGVAFGMRNILSRMEEGRKPLTALRGCGGILKSELWKKIIADVTGKPIILTANSTNAGILGAAIIAAVGSGAYQSFQAACNGMTETTAVIEPDMKEHKAYDTYYRKYLSLYKYTKPLFSGIDVLE